jgi:hypothetical protein
MRATLQTQAKTPSSTPPAFTPVRGGLLQRKCGCGGTPGPTGECEECRKKRQRGTLQRVVDHPSSLISRPSDVPPIVHEVLHSPGQPLDPTTRAFMEPRFGHNFSRLTVHAGRSGTFDSRMFISPEHDALEEEADRMADEVPRQGKTPGFGQDFSQVRIHTDARAAESARSLQALAFTSGQHIAFASNQYQPSSAFGRRLLAHELTHVVQQRGSASANTVQRRGIFETIGIFLGLSEGSFSDKDLHDYLDKITHANNPEDDFDSDNKARAIVKKWRAGQPEYNLTGLQKALLIREMESGYVGSVDERSILDLLENSDGPDLRAIFTSGAVKAHKLLDDFSGDNLKDLRRLIGVRFKGGLDALLKGIVEPQAGAPAGAPKFPYSWAILKAKIGSPATVEELVAHLGTFTPNERDQAVKDVARQRADVARQAGDLGDQAEGEKDPARKTSLEAKVDELTAFASKLDLLIQTVSKDLALVETRASLSVNTKIPSAADKVEISQALKPAVKTDVTGVALPFASVLPGEVKSYEEKLRDLIPGMIARYSAIMVAGKGPAEHADPAKVHSLKELEDIGNVSKTETDAVFGDYNKGPALKADTGLARGNIHDLWADTEKNLSVLTAGQRLKMAKALMFYFFQSNRRVLAVNRAHNAEPRFTADDKGINLEAKSLEKLADEFTSTAGQVKTLNEIDRGWDASAGQGQINVQIFKKSLPDLDRDFLWDMFQTLIHEYLHTLVHSKYESFAETFGRKSNQFNTLIEGVDSYLDEVVWANIESRVNDPALRAQIEGPVYSLLPPITVKPPSRRRYASYAQAIKLVSIVGPRNVYAAYFLGETEKIGA